MPAEPSPQLSLPLDAPVLSVAEVYFVRHHRARRYVLRVDDDGRVRVTVPRWGSKREAQHFAARHRDWIEQQRARRRQRAGAPIDRAAVWALARQALPARLMDMAASFELEVRRVSVRNQRSRWGSCGPDGHVCLNWRLQLMPDWVRDYVIVHELMHLRRADHSSAYWALVAGAFPQYLEARQWLRDHGAALY
jgi:predicted metal-dependent hydrolase